MEDKNINKDMLSDIVDFEINKEKDFIKIDFKVTGGAVVKIMTTYTNFKKWYSENKGKAKGTKMFYLFLLNLIENLKEEEKLDEIVDDDGNIMANNDKPLGDGLVGTSNMDTEKIYRMAVPRPTKYYSNQVAISW